MATPNAQKNKSNVKNQAIAEVLNDHLIHGHEIFPINKPLTKANSAVASLIYCLQNKSAEIVPAWMVTNINNGYLIIHESLVRVDGKTYDIVAREVNNNVFISAEGEPSVFNRFRISVPESKILDGIPGRIKSAITGSIEITTIDLYDSKHIYGVNEVLKNDIKLEGKISTSPEQDFYLNHIIKSNQNVAREVLAL